MEEAIARRRNRPVGMSLEDAFAWYMPGGPPESGCWLWVHGKADSCYGGFMFEGRQVRAHIASYQVHCGSIPEGLLVLHDPVLCNTPLCVQPSHLRLGTDAENMADKIVAGTQNRGSSQHLAKLNDERVLSIRRRWREGERQIDLADEFGVRQTTISSVVRGETWKHLPLTGVAL